MIKEMIFAGMVIYNPMPANVIINEQFSVGPKSIECLALNMYHEARNQGSAGLLAVTAVVLNRLKDSRFPDTICEVIFQGPTRESWKTRNRKILPTEERKFYPIRDRCQFSWYCDGKSDIPEQKKTFKRLLIIAESIVYNKLSFIDITDGALFYHADYVTPAWAKTKIKTVEIQDHIFYRWETENEK